jgi:3-oxoadipate CoA-transferase beta subunit
MMEHNTRKGGPRLLEACTLPLTAVRCVKRVYTDVAVLSVTPQGFLVHEILPGISREELQRRTGAPLAFAPDCQDLITPDIALPEA